MMMQQAAKCDERLDEREAVLARDVMSELLLRTVISAVVRAGLWK